MDHRIELAERVDLRRNVLCASDGIEISHNDTFSLGERFTSFLCAAVIARMQHDFMTLAREQLPAMSPSPVDEPEMKMRAMLSSLS